MRIWLRHHRLSLVDALRRLASNPVASVLNLAVIGIALALPLAGYLVLDNLRQLAGRGPGATQVGVFMALDASRADVERIEAKLRASGAVARVKFIPKDEALAALKRNEALAEAIGTLKSNPLPDAFAVELRNGSVDAAEALARDLKGDAKVGHVQLDGEWLKRLDAFLGLGRAALLVLATLLGVGLVAVVFNTIRAQILTRRDEVEVSRLVGATDATIRRPFFYLGATTAGLGGVVACGIVIVSAHHLSDAVTRLLSLYQSAATLSGMDWRVGVTVVAASALLGVIGAGIAVSQHLHHFHPR